MGSIIVPYEKKRERKFQISFVIIIDKLKRLKHIDKFMIDV